MRSIRSLFYIFLLLIMGFSPYQADARPHVADSLVRAGDSLRCLYRFSESLDMYSIALEVSPDSLFRQKVQEKMMLSENGKSMAGFTYSPVVVARHRFSIEDFFLYYPLEDKGWRSVPNQLDSTVSQFSQAIYVPSESDAILYSATDENGIRNIYRTERKDTIWTLPELINEQLTSATDEVYPMLSPDGKHLYFSSKGLYGVGGHDLYVSEWNEATRDWDVPVNMGFPYSSPADDFLYVNTADGRYSIFASNRSCSQDSVWVYVLESDSMPLRETVDDPDRLLRISMLEPTSIADKVKGSSDVKMEQEENKEIRKYMDQMDVVRSLKDSIASYNQSLDLSRERYGISSNQTERKRLADDILRRESMIPVFQRQLDEAVSTLQNIEMEFLFSGVVIDPDQLLQDASREIVGETVGYAFSKMQMGDALELNMEKPEPKFDYTLKVLEVGQFAEDNTIPSGIIYQIQIFSSVTKASEKNLKGLSPVFEIRTSNGRYTYRVGLFSSYSDVLSCVNTVKKAGFKGAFVVGYVDGKETGLAKVRELEKKRKAAEPKFFKVTIVPDIEALDEVAMEGIIQQAAGKDVARIDVDGVSCYSVGPFDKREKAEEFATFVTGMGYGKASITEVAVKK